MNCCGLTQEPFDSLDLCLFLHQARDYDFQVCASGVDELSTEVDVGVEYCSNPVRFEWRGVVPVAVVSGFQSAK